MKIKIYFGYIFNRHYYNCSSRELLCVSLDRKTVAKRLSEYDDTRTEIKFRTLDTENPEVLRYMV